MVGKKGIVRASVMLAALALMLCGSTIAEATFPGTPGKIAFSAGDIVVMNADGSGQVNVTDTTDIDESNPDWSPDGQRLIFTRDSSQAWVTDAEGSIETPLPIAGARHASWSPDGQKVVFVRGVGSGCSSVHTADLSGAFEALVVPPTAGPCYKSRPTWSPAGNLIAFDGYDPPGPGGGYTTPYIHSVHPDGSDLSGRIATGIGAAWSPAGHRIMYGAWFSPFQPYELYTTNPDGSGKLPLNPFAALEGVFGVWSPDGKRVAYSENNGIAIVDDAGGNREQITEFAHYEPDWQAQPPLPPEDPGYPRPRGATPFRVPLVPAYRECTEPNRTHAEPFSYGSCAPPQQVSDALTVGTPDANGQPASSIGRVILRTIAGNPATTDDEADVLVDARLTDVRCRLALFGYCSGEALSDYLGSLELVPVLRITDRRSGGAARDPATGFDVISFSVPVPCTDTPSAPAGSTCATLTTLDALAPGTITEGKRSIWELGQMTVRDGGIDDHRVDAYTTFAVQGVFVP